MIYIYIYIYIYTGILKDIGNTNAPVPINFVWKTGKIIWYKTTFQHHKTRNLGYVG